MRERTMNLKMYSRALRVRRMGSHCSPRLDTSRYLFSTDISFLPRDDRGAAERGEIGDKIGKRGVRIIRSELSFRLEVNQQLHFSLP